MIWDEQDVNSTALAQAKASGATTLLGFNEPDHTGQANMSVEQALAGKRSVAEGYESVNRTKSETSNSEFPEGSKYKPIRHGDNQFRSEVKL
jgi:hypothetical protein